jgi:hypothetical protein
MIWNPFKSRPKAAPVAQVAKPRPRGEFHAVQIVSNGVVCEAARALSETRFLSREGPPTLPLAQCAFASTCQCRYQHHADRRRDVRRNSDHAWGPADKLPPGRERRRTGGRRASDQQVAQTST